MKKKDEIRQLELQLQGAMAERYPHVPDYALPRPHLSDATANGLTKCIISFLIAEGWQAERINTTGMPEDDGNGHIKWRSSNTTKGSADISATINGRSVKIEVKIGADRQSDAQKRYQQAIEAAKGIYYIAKDFASFKNWYDNTQF